MAERSGCIHAFSLTAPGLKPAKKESGMWSNTNSFELESLVNSWSGSCKGRVKEFISL